VAIVVQAAVEGITDEAVVKRLAAHVGAHVGAVYGKNGKPALRQRMNGYNQAARHAAWIVVADLDRDHDCAPRLVGEWISEPSALMCFRVAVRAVEAWLLADGEAIAGFLGVARTAIPATSPDDLDDPKRTLVDLASKSRRREIREDMVPRPASGRSVGPAYASRLIEFATSAWRPEAAAERSQSLRRAIASLERLVGAHARGGR
jgi:hypothetical protein